jgi:hypothetical protein
MAKEFDTQSDRVSADDLAAGTPQQELRAAITALTEATRSLAATSQQLAQLSQGGGSMLAGQPGGPGVGTPASPSVLATVNAWEDDPYSQAVPTANPPVATLDVRPIPSNTNPRLQTRIAEPQPVPRRYPPGTPEFRYWTTAEAIMRGINFWSALLPAGTTWSTANPMQVRLVAGEDLNANYSRTNGLRFYHRLVSSVDVFSCESPDVACHELGHALLDAVRPQLFNAASTETGAFHESFGDMCAMLSALQLQPLRAKVLAETNGRLNVNSRLSRLAEQLGWAIRHLAPTAVDPDCLRNGANRFSYQRPSTLPPSAPANRLSSGVHSFSRVFTGAFLDALAHMLGTPNDTNLQVVSHDIAQLLVDAVRAAPITTAYFSQVGAAMIQADRARYGGRYRTALTSAFVGRGILSVPAAMTLAEAPVSQLVTLPVAAAAFDSGSTTVYEYEGAPADDAFRMGFGQTPELPLTAVTLDGGLSINVHAAEESPRFAVAPAMLGGQDERMSSAEEAAAHFIEDLIQQGRIDLKGAGDVLASLDHANPLRKTHLLVRDASGAMVLKREHFDCMCCGGDGLSAIRACRLASTAAGGYTTSAKQEQQ